ncbi:MAG: hypothetical protein ABH816_01290 [Candidatus Levyibacteriota bacterium]
MGGEGASIGVHPEGPKAPEPKPTPIPEAGTKPLETKQEKSALERATKEERVAGIFKAGRNLIAKNREGGRFDSDESLKQKAEKAASYDGSQGVTKNSSDSLKAAIDVLSGIKDSDGNLDAVSKIALDEITPFIKVRVVDETGDKLYSLSEWEEKLSSVSSDERTQLEAKGLYGFKFPKEKQPEEPKAEEADLRLVAADGKISEYRQGLVKEILELKSRGQNTAGKEQLLKDLRLADEANGEAGALLKLKALRDLEKSGVIGLKESIEAFEERQEEAKKKVVEAFEKAGMSDVYISQVKEAIGLGNIESIFVGENRPEIEGLDILIFGREMSEDELAKLLDVNLDPNKKGNKWALLMILAAAVYGVFKETPSPMDTH